MRATRQLNQNNPEYEIDMIFFHISYSPPSIHADLMRYRLDNKGFFLNQKNPKFVIKGQIWTQKMEFRPYFWSKTQIFSMQDQFLV